MSETTDLTGAEGIRLFVYDDATGQTLGKGDIIQGNPTIAIGRNVGRGGEGLIANEVRIMLADDIADLNATLGKMYPWWAKLDQIRRDVVSEMAFNMGIHGFSQFHLTIKAIAEKDFFAAGCYMLESEAARVAPDRYKRLSMMMTTGER